jgi:hypothetical protein
LNIFPLVQVIYIALEHKEVYYHSYSTRDCTDNTWNSSLFHIKDGTAIPIGMVNGEGNSTKIGNYADRKPVLLSDILRCLEEAVSLLICTPLYNPIKIKRAKPRL